jgi:hypothetical protein
VCYVRGYVFGTLRAGGYFVYVVDGVWNRFH